MRRFRIASVLAAGVAALFVLIANDASAAPKPEKLPVAFGGWTGKGAGSWKSALRSRLNKECVFVGPKKARALIEGTITEKGKGISLRIVVKAAKTGEIVETKEFAFSRPAASGEKAAKLARAIVEITRRAPTD